MKLDRLIERQRRRNHQIVVAQRQAAERGEQRHHEIDERFDIIESNTGRIVELERRLTELEEDFDAHDGNVTRHTGKP